ncbi:hypothetical protein F5X99DRAFT_334679 [Biscogniauxia marginata]|nr:hypothetical protein F5X99DRAFT_334679 [Biscogniauxia marginata]
MPRARKAMIAAKLPFAAHAVVETVAAFSFIFHPDKQLPGCSPAAKLILRQYGGLLLTSSLICAAILAEPSFSGTARLLSVALGTYHIWPCHRAYVRIQSGLGPRSTAISSLGGPTLHLAVHLACFGLFLFTAISPSIVST